LLAHPSTISTLAVRLWFAVLDGQPARDATHPENFRLTPNHRTMPASKRWKCAVNHITSRIVNRNMGGSSAA